jgi:hypothetical protein
MRGEDTPSRPRRRAGLDVQGGLMRIEFDMMRKGHVIVRGKKQVRQIGVTVHGATRLVTSGDMVDLATYEALVLAGVIDPPPEEQGPREPTLEGH